MWYLNRLADWGLSSFKSIDGVLRSWLIFIWSHECVFEAVKSSTVVYKQNMSLIKGQSWKMYYHLMVRKWTAVTTEEIWFRNVTASLQVDLLFV